MSVKALEWASNVQGISRRAKIVLKEIANRYNDKKGRAWPSQARMARDTGYSRSTINRALNELEEKGLIIRIASFDTNSQARTSNRYFLPQYAPDQVPQARIPIQIDQYFDHHGTSQTDEWQETAEHLSYWIATKSPSLVP